jgi:molecular chaperone HscB
MNYFELFDLPVAPVVDKTILAKKYFELQRKFHPDFYSHSTDEEREEALQQSANVNKAFILFKDSLQTIEYFLQLKGAIAEGEKYSLPNSFLMEMMEINELLDEGKEASNIPQYQELETNLEEEVRPLLSAGNNDMSDAGLEALKAFYYKKKYLKRILDRLND